MLFWNCICHFCQYLTAAIINLDFCIFFILSDDLKIMILSAAALMTVCTQILQSRQVLINIHILQQKDTVCNYYAHIIIMHTEQLYCDSGFIKTQY